MEWIAQNVVKHKKIIVSIFMGLILVSGILSKIVDVNYDLTKYLPEDSPSTVALNIMNKEFETLPSNGRILVENVTTAEALAYKEKIASIQGVIEVKWLDDVANIYMPLEMLAKEATNKYYKDSQALFEVVIEEEQSIEAVEQLQKLIEGRGELTGEIVDTVVAKMTSGSESTKILIVLLPIILIILLLTTSSWFEPVLFMVVIMVAIVMNNGTNVFLGEISFITKSTSSILLLAVSMDYSIFLLHRFSEYREKGLDVEQAMIEAMKKSFSSILSSGLTTAIGFGALIFMRFKIGPDLGIVLAKGVCLGMASIVLLLPVLTLYTCKIIDKTKHKPLVPSFGWLSQLGMKIGPLVICIVLLMMYPAFMAQSKNDFIYGASAMTSSGGTLSQTDKIFGQANNVVLMVPKGDVAKEKELGEALLSKAYVGDIISYAHTVGAVIPQGIVGEDKLSQLQSPNYSRMVLTLRTPQESESSFSAIEEIRMVASHYYGDEVLLAGGTVNVYDIKETIVKDNGIVTWIGILGIGLVLLFTFKSWTIPLILVITIETSIWLNLSFTYFADQQLAYLGYMIISAIQLGATVDYAILFTNRYIENRRQHTKKLAAKKTISDTALSILTSASILIIAGIIMGSISSNGVISQLGTLIGRGTFLSMTMVFFFLPTALVGLDQLIQKTSSNYDFYKKEV